jgi:asparagine synthase (glutamine-hydrolysing)
MFDHSVTEYVLGQSQLTLKADVAAEEPVYIYFSKSENKLCYSKDLVRLLDSAAVPKPLSVSDRGISFLLQSGVVPPPYTVYQDVFILGVGDKGVLSTKNGKIILEFEYEFPFLNANRSKDDSYDTSYETIQKLLLDATLKRIDSGKKSFLFHSAGKDSNPVAIALAEAGMQDQFTLVTHKTKRNEDESGLSKEIAKRLGFEHRVLNEVEKLTPHYFDLLEKYFINAPLPCTNNIAVLYPLYAGQYPDLQGCNLIDGSGGDVYIGHVPSASEFKRQKLAKIFSPFRWVGERQPSSSKIRALTKTRAEWTGLAGLSCSDSREMFKSQQDVSAYWRSVQQFPDYFDFRASVRGRIIDTELYMRKARNFCDAFGNNMVFPWANEKVARHFMFMPERSLFDRQGFRNKLPLRNMLKDKIGIDSDQVGKRGYPYDLRGFVLKNKDFVVSQIESCELWSRESSNKVVTELSLKLGDTGRIGVFSSQLLYQIFMVSSWYNNCRWL